MKDMHLRNVLDLRLRAFFGAIAALVVLSWAAFATGCSSDSLVSEASADSVRAERLSGGAVEVLKGSRHTVYHSTAALPTLQSPRADGQPTLIWFSGTWCVNCSQMDDFAYDVAEQLASKLAFVEKSVDHDAAAVSRYGVTGTPSFVLVDARGEVIARFFFQGSATAFDQAIKQALAKAGG